MLSDFLLEVSRNQVIHLVEGSDSLNKDSGILQFIFLI